MPDEKVNGPEDALRPQTAAADDPLAALAVFDRLEVGPVRLEPKRLIAPYRLYWDGKQDATELIYTYEERVFDPLEAESQNLAGMIAAQVALNYGLFCRSMVFHGLFDETDRRFLRKMAENTAREIFVKKFLEPNLFLVGNVAGLPPIRKKSYLRAVLDFHTVSAGRTKTNWHLWPTDKARLCVLSSGGKDSLLSYALLDELGLEVHPVFVNESGRHWFTALNAYRHFKDKIAHTARVWVNSDRVFSWMLQRMPFIRRNFGAVRSDEYPVRLWTVAVFLFGALPLMRKRGIGRLVVGDEYDTSRRVSFKGIPHYDGLYDQSLFFDHALSSFFMRKGWSIRQFSVLRPLSELLIEKILAERYPLLQQQQISCHAAHQKEDRIHPCGSCEKCRRIVGMLLALDADPKRCGYTAQQIQGCLEALALKGIHQEAEGEHQLKLMLMQKGLLKVGGSDPKTIKAYPEVLKLRFDQARSPLNAVPLDLRKPLFEIYLEHAAGAVQRTGRHWKDFNPLTDAGLSQAYPFEMDPGRETAGRDGQPYSAPDIKYLWGELTWPDAESRLKTVDIALLPVGAIEQHGPHLPLDTDAFDADYLARRVAEACSNPKPLVLPLIPYGVSYHHDDFKGTVSINNDTLSRLVYDIGLSAAKNGIKKLVIINAHGGNSPALNYAAQMINRDARIFVCVDTGESSDVDLHEFIDTPNDVHAGEIETSTSLAVRPYLVKMDQARRSVPKFSSRYLDFTSRRSVAWYAYTRKISSSGVMGDPTKADAVKGEKIWAIMIAHLVAFVEELKGMTLDEIHQQRL